MLDKLQSFETDVELLREFAIYSFHSLGRDEAEEKRKRAAMRSRLKRAIAGYKSAMEVYFPYASAPDHGIPALIANRQRFRELYDTNEYLAKEVSAWLEKTAKNGVFTTKRLGVNWQCSYLFLMKAYVESLSGWEESQIWEVITHVVAAAHTSLNVPIPHDLRALLRKAIRGFEGDSRNANIIGLLRHAAGSPKILYEMFPRLS